MEITAAINKGSSNINIVILRHIKTVEIHLLDWISSILVLSNDHYFPTGLQLPPQLSPGGATHTRQKNIRFQLTTHISTPKGTNQIHKKNSLFHRYFFKYAQFVGLIWKSYLSQSHGHSSDKSISNVITKSLPRKKTM